VFDDVARDIAGGDPPQWLVQALSDLAWNVAGAGLSEAGDPSRAELRSRFHRVRVAADNLERALDAIGDGRRWMTLTDLGSLRTARGGIRTAVEFCDRTLKRIPSGGGRGRARRQAGPTARVICAIIIAEAWTTVHGQLRGGHNERIGEICMTYWLACGGPPIGKASKGGGPNNWRRSVKRALNTFGTNCGAGPYKIDPKILVIPCRDVADGVRQRAIVVRMNADGRSRKMTSATHLEPALVRIGPACRYLDVGRSKFYELVREGKLEVVKIGKSARVTTASLKRFVESLPASPGGSPIKRADAPSLEDLDLK
jgi:excisionase family DNA binding protein